MKAKMLKASKNIQEGVFYELDTPITCGDKTYNVVCTWSSKAHQTMILVWPARSGVLGVVRENGKLRPEDDLLSVDGYIKSAELLAQLGYEIA